MKTIRGITCSLAATALLLGLQCSPVANNGSGSTTETANVKGFLYTSDGTTPAKGAKVYLVPADHNPRQGLAKTLAAAPESTVTNDSGVYKLDSVPAGTYNVLAAGSGNLAFQDSIGVKTDSQTQVPPDTLKAPGGLRGLIRLQPGDDARTVFLLFMGTNTWGTPDDSTGKFGVANMAEGTYRVRILTTLDAYLPKDTVLSVTAGKTDTLTHDIVLLYTGIPVVGGLKIAYDTLKQIVTLNWNRPLTGRKVAGYNVYRKFQSADSIFVKIKSILTDTAFKDSTATQDQTYAYRVTAVDTNGTEGVNSAGVNVYVVSGFVVVATIGNGTGSGTGQFNGFRGLSVDTLGNVYCVDEGNSRIQVFNKSGGFLRQWGTMGSGNGQFQYPRDISLDSLGHTFVLDVGNSRVQRFSDTGAFELAWGTSGTADSQFAVPTCLTVFGGRVYVGDATGQRIQEFGLDGSFISSHSVGGAVMGIAVGDSGLYAILDDTLVVHYSGNFSVRDTVLATGILARGSPGTRLNSLSLNATGDTAFAGNLSLDAVWGIISDGTLALRFSIAPAIGSPQDVYCKAAQVYVALHTGYLQVYAKR